MRKCTYGTFPSCLRRLCWQDEYLAVPDERMGAATCEQIVGLLCIQAAKAAAKIPFTGRDFQQALSEEMYIRYISELPAAAVLAE